MKKSGRTSRHTRLKITICGAVQGVGFRPFVHRLATGLGLAGWVNNSPQGVFIELEGAHAGLEQFLLRLEAEKPPHSFVQNLEATWLDPVGHKNFEIRKSETGGGKTTLVLPDIATCPDCLRETFDPKNRRYRYPFTNCTHCGPRFSIIESLPYDRANTSMRRFQMCPQCLAEYNDPRDRRFHAQPNACPVCGPRLTFWNAAGEAVFGGNEALLAAANAIRRGRVVAVKGLGGFHLMVAAHNEKAVGRLRRRKQREEKPLALMFPSRESVQAGCVVSPLEERLLRSPESPIVLLKKIANRKSQIANSVAPGNPCLGAMLPYTPLHHLLLAELGFPVVATSGNLSDEPICIDEHEALERLGGIADVFLVHDRPIVRHVDDSIVRVMLDRELLLRRARGYAPLPIQLPVADCGLRNNKSEIANRKSEIVLAVGAHLKNAVALSVGDQVFVSQHIGDLETEQAHEAFRRVITDFQKLYGVTPTTVAADLHPDYLSTKYAQQLAGGRVPNGSNLQPETCNLKLCSIQHHIAHVLSCMAENELPPPVLGVSWDGTGYGLDGTVWGGEFFLVTGQSVERVASLRPFRLPGGEKAVKEPRRAALGLLRELAGGDDNLLSYMRKKVAGSFLAGEMATLFSMLERKVNSPLCSSVGRLFDAVASLTGLRQQTRFEGQAAMELEFALDGIQTEEAYSLPVAGCRLPVETTVAATKKSESRKQKAEMILDWSPMVREILADVENGVTTGLISAKFHHALAEGIVAVAGQVGQTRVVLSGGCFQNRYLTERAVQRLQAEGFQPYWHQRVPPNDGGIALGQIVAARRQNG